MYHIILTTLQDGRYFRRNKNFRKPQLNIFFASFKMISLELEIYSARLTKYSLRLMFQENMKNYSFFFYFSATVNKYLKKVL